LELLRNQTPHLSFWQQPGKVRAGYMVVESGNDADSAMAFDCDSQAGA
jgi:hypothetical protein